MLRSPALLLKALSEAAFGAETTEAQHFSLRNVESEILGINFDFPTSTRIYPISLQLRPVAGLEVPLPLSSIVHLSEHWTCCIPPQRSHMLETASTHTTKAATVHSKGVLFRKSDGNGEPDGVLIGGERPKN